MSNNLASQQLSIMSTQMGQVDTVDSSLVNKHVGVTGPMSSSPALHQFAVSNQQMVLVEPTSDNVNISNKQMGQMKPKMGNYGPKFAETESMLYNQGSQKSVLPSKRKATVEPILSNAPLQQSPKPLSVSAPLSKRTVQMHSMSNIMGSQNSPAPSRRIIKNESTPGKSGSQRVQASKNRVAPVGTSPRVQTESSDAIRSKMRESLASALALVQQESKAPNKEKNASHVAAIAPQQTQEDSKLAESTRVPVDVAGRPENSSVALPSKETCLTDARADSRSTFSESFTSESVGSSVQAWKSIGQDQSNTVFLDGDVSFCDNFFVKDELLQGNGLSWAWEMDMQAAEMKEVQTAEKPSFVAVDVGGDGGEQSIRSPQTLASKIEAELYKLFGGVNKKYKEKGRSLMFNLKDRSNPELRERVMSGEISPERLCSMTAEELASKELSEWRMAKAEELAQMIVLPDSDVDMRRRLVKKTHKGEYQVEVEQDDSASVEVSAGITMLPLIRQKDQKTGADSSLEANESKDEEREVEKNKSEKQDPSFSLTIPADGTDLMQGLIVDEFKDAEFLPPIVSLDEFMESLNSEPPFEVLPVDAGQAKPALVKKNSEDKVKSAGQAKPVADKETSEDKVKSSGQTQHVLDKGNSENLKSETRKELKVSDPAFKDAINTNAGKADKMDVQYTELEVNKKSNKSPVEQKAPPSGASTLQAVWEGVLQLTISAPDKKKASKKEGEKNADMILEDLTCAESGENTSTKEWPNLFEIKGRVRLDAFEKFLQELPMSRSRAVMVAQFVLKEGSSESEVASLSEAVDSYVLDERLGFAEPAPGIEVYFCPPHPKIVEMISTSLSKDKTEIINSTENSLIGVVVWRKLHLSSAISPNSSSHHKHGSKKQHLASRRQHEHDSNVNVNLTSKAPVPFGRPPIGRGAPPGDDDDDDDIPPGFGPAAARDVDDLPEFNFSGNQNPSVPKLSSQNTMRGPRMAPPPSRPVDQMRQLVQQYGQIGSSWQDNSDARLGIQPWNDDDDDIPEWQPDAPPQQQPRPHLAAPGFHQPMRPHVGSQVPERPPANMAQNVPWQQGATRWVQPPNVGQYHVPRSRGF
ncbi:hypothetical protein RJ640_022603 [Escallonia rubra]|uniref:TFIIS central domain-containing protein n=1 Tax=Escallonia rubra TaxID=112253 RepID=A0AA88UIA7_9ASTE|nr:hypothetical protein RJ640_022603 [Escallonia rubra]